jgi:hypothetical protein
MTTKIKGIPLELGGTVYTLPPASFGTLETLAPRLDAFNAAYSGGGGAMAVEHLSTVVDLVHCSLRRNYPELARATVAENLGLEQMQDVVSGCYDVSGLYRKQKEQEAEAAQQAATAGASTLGESTGTASTLTS